MINPIIPAIIVIFIGYVPTNTPLLNCILCGDIIYNSANAQPPITNDVK